MSTLVEGAGNKVLETGLNSHNCHRGRNLWVVIIQGDHNPAKVEHFRPSILALKNRVVIIGQLTTVHLPELLCQL